MLESMSAMETKRIANSGLFYAALSALMWGSTAAVTKLLLFSLSNAQVLFISNVVATVVLLLISLAQGKLKVVRSYRTNDYLTFAAMGFLGVFLYRYFLQAALVVMSAQEAFIVNYTWPIMVVLFAWILLKESMTPRKLLGLLMSFLGVMVVVTKGDLLSLHFNVAGVSLALAGAVVYGLYSALGKRQHYDKYTSTAFFYLFSCVFSGVLLLGTSSWPALNLHQVFGLVWLGVFPSALAFVFWLLALKYGDTGVVSNFIFVTPFLSLIYIYFLLGETVLLSSVIGLLIIVCGILIQSVNLGRAVRQNNTTPPVD